jgi:diacylglycerol kinase family enzyme
MDGTAGADLQQAVPAGTARLCILMNPGSGREGGDGAAETIGAWLAGRGGSAELRLIPPGTSPAEAARAAARDGFATIVAAGGDGTVGGVAAGLAGTGLRMGVLPLGTFNFFARANGIPEALPEALALLETGRAEPRDAAFVNGRLFLNNASIGIYPRILLDRERVYRRWGRSRIAAYWSVVRTVAGFRRSRRLKVTVDGRARRVKTPLVFVAFNAYQLEHFGLDGADRIRRGEFAVLVAPDCGRFGLLRFALLLLVRGMRRGKDFELLCGREVVIDAADGRHTDRLVARDGEKEWIEPPLTLTIGAGALNVIVPQQGEAARREPRP